MSSKSVLITGAVGFIGSHLTAARSSDHDVQAFAPALAGLQAALTALLDGPSDMRVLDAGCGSRMHLRLSPHAHIVGIDISAKQLAHNDALDERILGDIQTYSLPPASFDLVLCWDTLEHLRRPQLALENLKQALRPGGLMVLGGPNPLSLKGLVTWLTPYWVHRLAYRGSSERPFKTYRRLTTSPVLLARWARNEAMQTEYFATYESPMQVELRRRLLIDGRLWRSIRATTRRLSGQLIDLPATDFMLVVKR
jgi:SAM-dependent methyltransferase